ncbi:MAG: hypothetical protein ACJ72D_07945 [Marmoricola sp.]
MSRLGRASVIALPVALVALVGCGSDATRTAADDTPSASSPTSAGTPTGTGTASGPATAASGSTATDCPATTRTAIPDGTWTGPITMDVQGQGGKTGFGDSKGTGTMDLVVAGGKVTGGTWNVRWTSVGHADTGQAEATIRLTGKIRGTVNGTAAKPVLPGSWTIHGTAKITKPVHATAPVDESGKDSETMTVESTACDAVTGTFLPSFNSKNAAATFTGTARWVGTRKG